eukprot:TRINITY_DN18416_c0_g1_i1.p1 TRINITY_DN18416_c0_g1~~TRINITY_DN18416_c0_g1_i1.p1  ORF type:complete len:239 (-),score=47.33 TRINITY_DN18416_c0_g1_i1:237-953(-)
MASAEAVKAATQLLDAVKARDQEAALKAVQELQSSANVQSDIAPGIADALADALLESSSQSASPEWCHAHPRLLEGISSVLPRVLRDEDTAKPVLGALLDCLMSLAMDPSEVARQACKALLFAIADLQDELPPPLFEHLAPALGGVLANPAHLDETKAIAAFALGRLPGDAAMPFVPLLEQCLDNPKMEVKMTVIGALGMLGRSAFPAVTRMKTLAERTDCDAIVREALLDALRQIEG